MRRRHIEFWYLCTGLLILLAPAWSAVETTRPADPNDTRAENRRERELSHALEDMLLQLRELRANYYTQKAQDDVRIETARRNSETLGAELEDLRRQEAELDRQIQKYESEAQNLSEQLVSKSALEEVIRRKTRLFVTGQRAAIENGPPYKLPDRIARLQAACNDSNDAPGLSATDQFASVWSYAQEELRLARSSETYTGRAPAREDASPYARYFRVGQLILGYVTEDDLQAAMWSQSPDEKGWLPIADPKQSDRVRQAVDILDRRRGPELVILPVAVRSESAVEEDR